MNEKKNRQILVTDIAWPSVEPEAKILARVGGVLVLAKSASEEELLALVPAADAILTCWAQVPASVVKAGKRLQVISRYGIGLDNIAVDEATKHGIVVTNVPAYCLDEVSDHAMALILASARKVCLYSSNVHAGDWNVSSGKPLFRVRGRTLGIIGFGKIGQTLAPKALAFGMRVLAYDPYLDSEYMRARQCEKAELNALLAEADYVSIHSPLNDGTRGMIDEARLRKMKPTAFIVNTSRGAIIDQEALVTALEQGWIAGAGMDVFVPERIPPDHPLLKLSNVIATPHVAFYSEESLVELEVKAAENVAAVLSGKRPSSIVNPEVLDLPRWAQLA
ncbi:MAG: C-terminal binding protein [Chloroflexi bacterium]|nr:C-terminal binding protein [Chloroflexota bacterium]